MTNSIHITVKQYDLSTSWLSQGIFCSKNNSPLMLMITFEYVDLLSLMSVFSPAFLEAEVRAGEKKD